LDTGYLGPEYIATDVNSAHNYTIPILQP